MLRRSASVLNVGRTRSSIQRPKHVTTELKKVSTEERLKRRTHRRGALIHTKAAMIKEELQAVADPRDLRLAQLADAVWSKGGSFLASATNIAYVPNGNPAVPEVMLCGREGCGKTSLLRALYKSRYPVSKSNSQVRSQCINYFDVGGVFNIAETPGFGRPTVPWSMVLENASLLRNFVRCRPSLKMVYFCLDATSSDGLMMRDVDLLRFMQQEMPNFTIVLTKVDKLNGAKLTFGPSDIKEELLRNGIEHPIISTSAFALGGIDTLRFDMLSHAVHALPTERLSLTESKKLGDRLMTQLEMSTVSDLPLPVTKLDEETLEWREEEKKLLLEDFKKEEQRQLAAASSTQVEGDDENLVMDVVEVNEGEEDANWEAEQEELENELALVEGDNHEEVALPAEVADAIAANEALIVQERQEALASVTKKANNKELLKYVGETSPWRNPMIWPTNVIPTKHLRSNIMRCPKDPLNPYLSQPSFVAPRMDMVFRKPNVSWSKNKKKGMYLPERESKYPAGTTIPYFPDIVDARLTPTPWMFVGSREAFYERGNGKRLALTRQQHALEGKIDPIANVPSADPALNVEVAKLEAKRYGAPIAFLKPKALQTPKLGGSEVAADAPTAELPATDCDPQGTLIEEGGASPLTNPL